MDEYRTPSIREGTQIGPYIVGKPIGCGGMGEVYRVRHEVLQGDYALKMLHFVHPAIRDRFFREGCFQSRIRHNNVVRVHDMLPFRGYPVLVMDLVDGGNLEDFLSRRGSMSPNKIDPLARGIIHGVRAAHEMRIAHRDLKPLNILLQRSGNEIIPKITDFGLAKLMEPGERGITLAGQVFGSPNYMAPEQYADSSSVDHRADIFALGCILYELVTMQRAFPGDRVDRLREAISHGQFIPIRQHRPDCPERMRIAIEGCLLTDPDERIDDCETLEEIWSGVHTNIWGDHTLRMLGNEPSPREDGASELGAAGVSSDPGPPGDTLILDSPDLWSTELSPGSRELVGAQDTICTTLEEVSDEDAKTMLVPHHEVSPSCGVGTTATERSPKSTLQGEAKLFLLYSGVSVAVLSGALLVVAIGIGSGLSALWFLNEDTPPMEVLSAHQPSDSDAPEQGAIFLAGDIASIRTGDPAFERDDAPLRADMTARLPPPIVGAEELLNPLGAASAPGTLTVILMNGGWANVYVDGVKLEKTAPFKELPVEPGTYDIRVENALLGLDTTERHTFGNDQRVILKVKAP